MLRTVSSSILRPPYAATGSVAPSPPFVVLQDKEDVDALRRAGHRKAVSYAPLRAALPQFGCAPFPGGDGVYHRANVSSWELIYRTTE